MKLARIIVGLALISLLAIPALGQMTDYQKGIAEGLKIGFFMNQKYVDAKAGINVTGYNAEVERYNAWIVSIFGNDPQFLMTPLAMGAGASSTPVLMTNLSNVGGIEHKIDGGAPKGAAYTTNDMNLLPDPRNVSQIQQHGGEYLGGI